jgi:hypothetical protein
VEYKNSGIWTCEKEDGGRIPAPKSSSLGRMFLDIILSCENSSNFGEEEEEEEEVELWREKEKQNLGGVRHQLCKNQAVQYCEFCGSVILTREFWT